MLGHLEVVAKLLSKIDLGNATRICYLLLLKLHVYDLIMRESFALIPKSILCVSINSSCFVSKYDGVFFYSCRHS